MSNWEDKSDVRTAWRQPRMGDPYGSGVRYSGNRAGLSTDMAHSETVRSNR